MSKDSRLECWCSDGCSRMEPNKILERKTTALQLVPESRGVSIFPLDYVLRVDRVIELALE